MALKITILMAMSLNGIISRKETESVIAWTSPEDKNMLYENIKSSYVLIMGRKSFQPVYKKLTAAPIYVMTNDINLLNKEKTQVIYTNAKPCKLSEFLSKQGLKNALLLGGVKTNIEFLQQGLVSEIKITIEPHLFSVGMTFITNSVLDKNLELMSVKQANAKSSLFLCYKVINEKSL